MQSHCQIVPITGIETLEQTFAGGDIEPTQLKPGHLQGVITVAQLAGTRLSAGSFRGSARARGPLSNTAHTIGVLLDANGSSSLWDYKTRSGDLAVIPPGVEHDARHDKIAGYATLEIPIDHLVEQAARSQPQLTETFWQNPSMYRPPTRFAGHIVGRFKTVLREIQARPKILNSINTRLAMADELSGLLLQGFACTTGRQIARDRTFISATRIVHDVDDYLREHVDEPVRSGQLCQHLAVSERSLHRAFRDVVDVPPAVYMRRWRLTQVRRMLNDPELAGDKVSDVAFHFGFWELGRFAGQYMALFGELPSHTLQRTHSTG